MSNLIPVPKPKSKPRTRIFENNEEEIEVEPNFDLSQFMKKHKDLNCLINNKNLSSIPSNTSRHNNSGRKFNSGHKPNSHSP